MMTAGRTFMRYAAPGWPFSGELWRSFLDSYAGERITRRRIGCSAAAHRRKICHPCHTGLCCLVMPASLRKKDDCHDTARRYLHSFARDLQSLVCLRSEEHTSELQSLMRISYAVFCLKKKINYIVNIHRQVFNKTYIILIYSL